MNLAFKASSIWKLLHKKPVVSFRH